MNDDIAIKVENLSKYYRLGVINNGTLFRDIQSWMARKRGKEDPHAKLGSKYDSTAEGFWALKDLNFEIKKGDRVGIIGHNGAGKSTLLKLLSQITSPTEGDIKIRGRIASLLEVGTGFHPELTGRENIFMNGAILGMTHAEIDSKVNQIIEFSEIGEHIDTPVKRYSSGMYVRLAFAVAAHLDSEILIADEVLAVGDAAFQKKALGKMNELSSDQGRTVLFVSHNMAQVKNLCNKGIILEKGKIIKSDNIEDCIQLYLKDSNRISLNSFKKFPDDLNKVFQLKSVCVLDDFGNNVDNFESQKNIIIRLTCISRKPIPGLYGWFGIKNEAGEWIIKFDSNEQESSKESNLPVGEYIWDINLPKGVLRPGNYIFCVNFASQYNEYGFDVDSPLDCCAFTVVDSITVRGSRRNALTSVIPEMKRIFL